MYGLSIRTGAPGMSLRCSVLAAAATIAVGAWSANANAQSEESSLSFVSEPGDYIGGGQSLTFTPANSQFSSMVSEDGRELAVSILPPGSFWYLHLAAPAGQQLVPGVYENAMRWPFQDPASPGLDLSGDGRGCNTLTGRFEVLEAVYAPLGYVERFHATFEQHCEGAEPALLGEVRISNPPPPPPMTMELTLDRRGAVQRVRGSAMVGGTVTCSQPTVVNLTGTLTQRASRTVLATGTFSASAVCATESTRWSAQVSPNGVPFNSGPAELSVSSSAVDPNLGAAVTVEKSGLIQLTGGKR